MSYFYLVNHKSIYSYIYFRKLLKNINHSIDLIGLASVPIKKTCSQSFRTISIIWHVRFWATGLGEIKRTASKRVVRRVGKQRKTRKEIFFLRCSRSRRRDVTVRGTETTTKKKRMAKFIWGIGQCTLAYIIPREGNGK